MSRLEAGEWREVTRLYEENVAKAGSIAHGAEGFLRELVRGLYLRILRGLGARQRRLLERLPYRERLRRLMGVWRTGRLFGMFVSRDVVRLCWRLSRLMGVLERFRIPSPPARLDYESCLRYLRDVEEALRRLMGDVARLRLDADRLRELVGEAVELIREKEALKPPKTMVRYAYAVEWVEHDIYYSVIGAVWGDEDEVEKAKEGLIEKVREYVEEEIEWVPYPGTTAFREFKSLGLLYEAGGREEVPFDPRKFKTYEIRKECLSYRPPVVEWVEEGRIEELY